MIWYMKLRITTQMFLMGKIMKKTMHLVIAKKLWGLTYYIDYDETNTKDSDTLFTLDKVMSPRESCFKTDIFGGDKHDTSLCHKSE